MKPDMNSRSEISPASPDSKSSSHKRNRPAFRRDHDDHNDSHIEVAPEEEEMLQDDEEEPLHNYDQARKRFCRRQTPFDDFDIDDEEDDTTTKLEVEVAQLRDTVDIMERQVAWAVKRMVALQGLVDLYENERRRSFVES
ncbi:hypothetical protein ATCC90586_006804 [Pythium insidiosum]|nr:hypothetical protein ATCC90586_006804 [Pythium insidiosum]